MLGHLRLDAASLRGRRYPEPPHPYRSDLQRDRDRIVHSRAFRRLQGKTQVFAADHGDHFRNRLTHTLEVSQVARTVASRLQLNEDYTEALALSHDLGHPPFGHVGEKELDRQMRRFGETFEHNRHALRIVDQLEQRYARFDGLNLTYEVREGIVKHSREINGDLDPELRDLRPSERPPLEAQLLDFADEIAYNTADSDDAFAMGLFTMEEVAECVPLFDELLEQSETQFPGASDRVRFWEVEREIVNLLVGGLIEGTVEAAKDAGVECGDDVRRVDRRLACFTPQTALLNAQLHSILVEKVYSYAELVDQRSAAAKTMGQVFEILTENPERVSAGYRERLHFEPAHRVVCDYIAGMTDHFLFRTHAELTGSLH